MNIIVVLDLLVVIQWMTCATQNVSVLIQMGFCAVFNENFIAAQDVARSAESNQDGAESRLRR